MCRLSFTLVIVRKHANLKSQIAAFMTPYKWAEFATFASTGNSREALLCQLKITSSEEVHTFRMYLILLNFLNLMNVKSMCCP